MSSKDKKSDKKCDKTESETSSKVKMKICKYEDDYKDGDSSDSGSFSGYNPHANKNNTEVAYPLPPMNQEMINYNIQMNYQNSIIEHNIKKLNVISK